MGIALSSFTCASRGVPACRQRATGPPPPATPDSFRPSRVPGARSACKRTSPGGERQAVEDADRLQHRADIVVPVGLARANAEHQIHFGKRAKSQGATHGVIAESIRAPSPRRHAAPPASSVAHVRRRQAAQKRTPGWSCWSRPLTLSRPAGPPGSRPAADSNPDLLGQRRTLPHELDAEAIHLARTGAPSAVAPGSRNTRASGV